MRFRHFVLAFLLTVLTISVYMLSTGRWRSPVVDVNAPFTIGLNALELAEYNYGDEVREYAQKFDLPPEYLLALIVLECSGEASPGSRFEKGVYKKLIALRDGERKKFEQIRQEDLADASDESIKNLATSWGPFQLMGYKCLGLDVEVSDIRGSDALYHGVRWINEEYGRMLRKKHFKDAFHYHNAGSRYPLIGKPRTHDPNYVSNGLRFMEYFKKKAAQQ